MCTTLLPPKLFNEKEKTITSKLLVTFPSKKISNFKYHVMIDIQSKKVLCTEGNIHFIWLLHASCIRFVRGGMYVIQNQAQFLKNHYIYTQNRDWNISSTRKNKGFSGFLKPSLMLHPEFWKMRIHTTQKRTTRKISILYDLSCHQ